MSVSFDYVSQRRPIKAGAALQIDLWICEQLSCPSWIRLCLCPSLSLSLTLTLTPLLLSAVFSSQDVWMKTQPHTLHFCFMHLIDRLGAINSSRCLVFVWLLQKHLNTLRLQSHPPTQNGWWYQYWQMFTLSSKGWLCSGVIKSLRGLSCTQRNKLYVTTH